MKTFFILSLIFTILSCDPLSQKNEKFTQPKFLIEGTWVVNDHAEEYSNIKLNFSEYTFGKPSYRNGKYLGKINLVTSKNNKKRQGKYEIIDEYLLVIYLENEYDQPFMYTYFPEEQKIEMFFAGQERILKRKIEKLGKNEVLSKGFDDGESNAIENSATKNLATKNAKSD